MDNLSIQYFKKLNQRKEKWIKDVLSDPSGKALLDSGVDKYADQAHFIYELLQNADDTNATEASFELKQDRLEFSHNGERHFNITNPDTEEEDKKNAKIGDINAIVSYGQSGKKESDEVKIGKFGAGFKSVYQYTSIPEIYDRDFCFRIKTQYIPELIENKDPRSNKNETLFILPFDEPEKAYDDISHKISSLKLPLLFLNHLKIIICTYNNKSVLYEKKVEETIRFKDCVAERICMTCNETKERLWLFTADYEKGFKYSVGFVIDEDDNIIKSNYDAFCYFLTKEHTGLNFIIHAPFLLTESRETIKADQKHNHEMVNLLSKLAVTSILHLKEIGIGKNKQYINDDVYLSVLPIDEDAFASGNNRDKLSFLPFYEDIKEMVINEKILPCTNGIEYVDAINACWMRTPQMWKTFNDEQLQILTENSDAKWIFKEGNNFNNSSTNNNVFYNYIDDVLSEYSIDFDSKFRFGFNRKIYDDYLLKNKNLSKLVNIDNVEWLDKLHEYCLVNESNIKLSRTIPVFLDTEGEACPAYNEDGSEELFLPSEIKTLRVIHPALYRNEHSMELLGKHGISEPSKIDQVRKGILKNYEDEEYANEEDFRKIFNIYRKLDDDDQNALIEAINKSNFVIPAVKASGEKGFASPDRLYFKTDELEKYFSSTNYDYFVFVDEVLFEDKIKIKKLFLEHLGVKTIPGVFKKNLNYSEVREIKQKFKSRQTPKWEESFIDGLKEILEDVAKKDAQKSVLIWNTLKKVIQNENKDHLSKILYGKYFWKSMNSWKLDTEFENRTLTKLKKLEWLVNKKGEFISPEKATIDMLPDKYDTASYEAKIIIKSLGIGDSRFNSEEMKTMIFVSELESLGLSREEIMLAAKEFKNKKENKPGTKQPFGQDDFDDAGKGNSTQIPLPPADISNTQFSDVFKGIDKKITELKDKSKEEKVNDAQEVEIIEQDDFIKPTIETTKKIEKKEKELAEEIDRIHREQELTQKIANSKKYSNSWFTSLLEKEILLTTGGEEKDKKKLSARFSLVEMEEGSERTLVLKNPIGKIPQNIEELEDVPLVLTLENDETVKVVVEAFNIHSYSIRAKLQNANAIKDINLRDVREALIEFKEASFLLQELSERFKELGKSSVYDYQKNLTSNIDFIFGPPGTGKTTHLIRDFIIPEMEKYEDQKILFLTPTNKSADVVINKIVEIYGDDTSYEDWLVRFGLTQDEKIDSMPIFKDKHVDVDNHGDITLVTTIHRFWYDFCIDDNGKGTNLRDIEWDYIIIDEASMVPLAFAVYPLFAKGPKKFIIAGDPFQIQPVIMAEEWKSENIYTMVNLNEFSEHPNTVPHNYKVELLTTQYRSIPEIGRVFSNLTYKGILSHYRKTADQKNIRFGDQKFTSINLIRYPVSRYESIYASKYLNRSSSYHVYSALLTYEFANYLSEVIESDEKVSIGIISPYRAQADIIEKLCRNIKPNEKVSIQVDTIHGFQGDECDIVICMFNTPPGALTGDRKLINNQNIINVAVSRARDYLFVITPEENTKGFENLTILNELIKIMKNSYGFSLKDSHSLEDVIFDDPAYLEENAFSTSHQSVNIYDLPEKKYEIRAEEFAVDIQVHKIAEPQIPQGTLQQRNEENINDDTINRIVGLISQSNGIKTKEIAKQLNLESSAVNDLLESNHFNDMLSQSSSGEWFIKNKAKNVAEETETEEEEDDENYPDFQFQIYLMDEAKRIFKNRNKFYIIENHNKGFSIKMNNNLFFRLDNHPDGDYTRITMKGKYLYSAPVSKKLDYSYSRSNKEFAFNVTYGQLVAVLNDLSKIDKIRSVDDEDLIKDLKANVVS